MNLSSTVLSEGGYQKDRHHWNTGGHLFNIASCSSTLMDSLRIMKPFDSKWWLRVNLERLLFWQGLASRCDYLAFRWIIFTITWTPGGENFGLCLYAKKFQSHTQSFDLILLRCIHCFLSKHLKSQIYYSPFIICSLWFGVFYQPFSWFSSLGAAVRCSVCHVRMTVSLIFILTGLKPQATWRCAPETHLGKLDATVYTHTKHTNSGSYPHLRMLKHVHEHKQRHAFPYLLHV